MWMIRPLRCEAIVPTALTGQYAVIQNIFSSVQKVNSYIVCTVQGTLTDNVDIYKLLKAEIFSRLIFWTFIRSHT